MQEIYAFEANVILSGKVLCNGSLHDLCFDSYSFVSRLQKLRLHMCALLGHGLLCVSSNSIVHGRYYAKERKHCHILSWLTITQKKHNDEYNCKVFVNASVKFYQHIDAYSAVIYRFRIKQVSFHYNFQCDDEQLIT